MTNELKCEGACDPHEGEVVPVTVYGGICGYKEGWTFNYCQAAIACDRSSGFDVLLEGQTLDD